MDIVLHKLPGAERDDIKEFEVEEEDGRRIYEGEVCLQEQEYEFEIDAETGTILEWDMDD